MGGKCPPMLQLKFGICFPLSVLTCPSCPRSHSLDQAGLELSEQHASVGDLGLNPDALVVSNIACYTLYFKLIMRCIVQYQRFLHNIIKLNYALMTHKLKHNSNTPGPEVATLISSRDSDA